ncbi:NAD-binding-2 domain-containing protein [Fusarium sp. LHS14.1]|nr:NAD-binding-2 domain-containing protein [Fusarium sp. LHS14.1]
MATPQALTFLGLGNMGSALVQALLKASHKVTIWNRTADRPQVRAAVEAGAALEVDVQTAISKNNIMVICLLDYSSIKSALTEISTSALEGKTIFNLTNGTPKQAREMAAWATSHSVKYYFDGAVMVPPQMIGGPQSFVVASGQSPEAFKSIASLLEPVGRPEYLGVAIDAAARYDLAALSSMFGMFSGMFVAMALLKKGHTAADEKLEPVVSGSLNPFLGALIPYNGLIARSWDDKAWDDNLGNPIGMQAQALRNILEACRDDGMDDGFLKYLTMAMEGVVKDRGENGGIAIIGEYLLNGRLTKE